MTAARKMAAQPMSASHLVLAHDGDKHFTLPAPEAWARLQALHHHSVLEASKPDGGANSKPVTSIYAKSLGSALGQFGTSHPELRNAMFESLLDHVDRSGSMEGLQSMYASGLTDAARRETQLHQRGATTLRNVGWPEVADGGLEHAPLRAKQRMTPFAHGKLSDAVAHLKPKPEVTVGGTTYVAGEGGLTTAGGAPGVGVGFGTDTPGLGTNGSDFGSDAGDTLGPIGGSVGSNDPTPDDPNPTRIPLGNNPGGSSFVLHVPDSGGPTESDFTSFGGTFSPLRKNPRGQTVTLPAETGPSQDAKKEINRLESRGGTYLDAHGHGFGTYGSGYVSLPRGRGPDPSGDPSSDPPPADAGTGTGMGTGTSGATGGAAAASRPTRSVGSKLTTDLLATGVYVGETAPVAAAEGAVIGAANSPAVAGAAMGAAMGVVATVLGGAALFSLKTSGVIKLTGSFSGPDEGGGSGSGPKSSSYMPSDEGGGPTSPKSRGTVGSTSSERSPEASPSERTPAPDDSSGSHSPVGPKARRGVILTPDWLPDPEGNSPGTPHG